MNLRSDKQQPSRGGYLDVVALFVVAAALVSAGCQKPTVQKAEPVLEQAVKTTQVVVEPMSIGRRYIADVVSARTVRVLAQVPGAVADLAVEEGEFVKRKAPLVKIAAPDVGARVSRVKSERKRAERERDFACGMVKTDEDLANSGDLSAFSLDRSRKNCSSATLAVDAAKAAEREAGVAKSRSVERAPFEGRVLKYLVDPGQTVMPGTPLVLFGSRDQQLRVRVPEADLEHIAVGSPVQTSLGSGRVAEIAAQALGPARLVEVLVDLEAPLVARVGTSVSATLVTEAVPNAATVPSTAVGEDADGSYVVVVENKLQRRVGVKVGMKAGGRVSIEPPLPGGTVVVASGVSSLDLSLPVMEISP